MGDTDRERRGMCNEQRRSFRPSAYSVAFASLSFLKIGRHRSYIRGHTSAPRGGEGGSPKADIVREVAWIYYYRSGQNADKGEREG